MTRHSFTPLVLWQVAEGYDPRIVAVTLEGLKKAAHEFFVATTLFEHPGGVWLGPFRDTLPGHLHRALYHKRLVDFSSGNFWQLLDFRQRVLNIADAQTIRAIDRVLADFVFNSYLDPAAVLDPANPQLGEWWIECEPLEENAEKIPLNFIVGPLLHERMSAHLAIPPDQLELALCDSNGQSRPAEFSNDPFGSFSCYKVGSIF